MDKWMEEDEELFKHARDPFKRVDALPSKRHVRVVIDGQTVAETRRPHLVFETNHPVRYYIPQEDVRMDMLVPSATTSRCPYKGPASYWSVQIGGETFSDLVWGYMAPIPGNSQDQRFGLFLSRARLRHLRRWRVSAAAEDQVGERSAKLIRRAEPCARFTGTVVR